MIASVKIEIYVLAMKYFSKYINLYFHRSVSSGVSDKMCNVTMSWHRHFLLLVLSSYHVYTCHYRILADSAFLICLRWF